VTNGFFTIPVIESAKTLQNLKKEYFIFTTALVVYNIAVSFKAYL
jgi:hypothetical protein